VPADDAVADWPESPGDEAFYGLAGDTVRTVAPHTEADSIALLVHLLVMFGNVIGPRAHYMVGETKHALNLFAIFVGKTGKGRKGTAHDQVIALFRIAAAEWNARVQSGLTSGEGLINAVRDPSPERIVAGKRVPADPGVDDKRLLTFESEFSSVIRNANRPGNILSATLRQAWDSGDLRVMAKNNPDVATGAHISIVGHISKEELQAELSSTDRANGFGNRFLYIGVARSKYLPEGGNLDPAERAASATRLRTAIDFAKTVDAMRRDDNARGLWAEVYPRLSDGQAGLAGAMLSRAEAQVLRLSCIYSLLDLSAVIRVEHLSAALALWAYVEGSVRYIFGTALGHPTADEILKALRTNSAGLTRTEIRDLFDKHAKAAEIAVGLNLLRELGLARCQKEKTQGRPIERWLLTAGSGPEPAPPVLHTTEGNGLARESAGVATEATEAT
jgi:hypothetical protein